MVGGGMWVWRGGVESGVHCGCEVVRVVGKVVGRCTGFWSGEREAGRHRAVPSSTRRGVCWFRRRLTDD